LVVGTRLKQSKRHNQEKVLYLLISHKGALFLHPGLMNVLEEERVLNFMIYESYLLSTKTLYLLKTGNKVVEVGQIHSKIDDNNSMRRGQQWKEN
jgi:hypothetical protein